LLTPVFFAPVADVDFFHASIIPLFLATVNADIAGLFGIPQKHQKYVISFT
jgi:hypothetical protein